MAEFISAPAGITFNGEVEVGENGAVFAGAEIIDISRPWKTRGRLSTIRNSSDQTSMDITNVYGQRINVRLGVTDYPDIPDTDDDNLDLCQSVRIRYIYTLNCPFMTVSQAQGLYDTFLVHQEYWAERDAVYKQLCDPGLSYSDMEGLAGRFESLLALPGGVSFNFIVDGGSGTFAPGDSFSAGSMGIDYITNTAMKIVVEVEV